jgi:uncharacterized integral membrane protein
MHAVLRFLRWVLFLLVAFIVVTFMVQNRDMVEVSLWPLPFVKPAPLWAVIVGFLLLGFLIGATSAWLSGGGTRKRARDLARANSEKAQQISQLQQQLAAQKQASALPKPPTITHAA